MKIKKQKSAQDIHDDIFRRMPAEESLRLAGNFYRFGMMLNKLGDHYDGTRRTFKENSRNSRKT